MDELLKEWLEKFPSAWDYWKFNEDWDALRKWYGPGWKGAGQFEDAQIWYDQAEKYEVISIRRILRPTSISGNSHSGRSTRRPR
jgi:hypothetical protein